MDKHIRSFLAAQGYTSPGLNDFFTNGKSSLRHVGDNMWTRQLGKPATHLANVLFNLDGIPPVTGGAPGDVTLMGYAGYRGVGPGVWSNGFAKITIAVDGTWISSMGHKDRDIRTLVTKVGHQLIDTTVEDFRLAWKFADSYDVPFADLHVTWDRHTQQLACDHEILRDVCGDDVDRMMRVSKIIGKD